MADAFQSRRVIGINDSSVAYVSYDSIGGWHRRFMNRHDELMYHSRNYRGSTSQGIYSRDHSKVDDVNLLIQRKASNQKKFTTWMKRDFQLALLKQHELS